jgi:hypothetical protein
MTRTQAARIYEALPRPMGEAVRQALPEIGEGIAAQFQELNSRPTVDGAERLVANLLGAAQVLSRYSAQLCERS